jgi:hypothetical protein
MEYEGSIGLVTRKMKKKNKKNKNHHARQMMRQHESTKFLPNDQIHVWRQHSSIDDWIFQ